MEGGEGGGEGALEASEAPGACGAEGGAWWGGCNACRCAGGAPACTRLWCGLPDCLAPAALPCRTDEVLSCATRSANERMSDMVDYYFLYMPAMPEASQGRYRFYSRSSSEALLVIETQHY